MPKNFQKTVIIRMFRQIPAKTGLESQCLCGVLEGTVEMEKARLGRGHSIQGCSLRRSESQVEMEKARLGR